jgi:tetratricopeptide (TPR) repeat protein
MNELQEAIMLVNQGNVELGLEKLEKIKIYADDETKYTIAQLYYDWGLMDKTKPIVEELYAKYPDESDLQIFAAEVHVELGDEDEAIDYLLEIDESDENFPRALLLLADLYEAQGLEEVAETKLLHAKRLKPNESVITLALAEFYLAHGQLNKCIPLYENLLNDKEELKGYNIALRLAEALSSTGKWSEALPYYEEGLKETKDFDSLNRFGFTLYKLEKYEKAIEVFQQLKGLDYEYTSAYIYLAKAYEALQNYSEALQQLEEGMKHDEHNPGLFTYAGQLALKSAEFTKAEQYLREAIALDPGEHGAIEALCSYFRKEERPEDIIELLSSVKVYGENIQPYEWDLAYAKNEIELFSEALNHYVNAYNDFNSNAEFLEEYGQFILQEGQTARAITLFKEALAVNNELYHLEELIQELEERL